MQRAVFENMDPRVFCFIMKETEIKCCVSKATENKKQEFMVIFLYLKWSAYPSNQEWIKYTNDYTVFNRHWQLHRLLTSSGVYFLMLVLFRVM